MAQAQESMQFTRRRGFPWSRVVIYGLLAFFAVVYLLPLFVMLLTSFKPLEEIYAGNMVALPKQWTIEPWINAWQTTCVGLSCKGIKGYFWNSTKMTVLAVAISTAIGLLNGYVLTKWKFKGANVLFGLILFGCFIPFQIVLIPPWRTSSARWASPLPPPVWYLCMWCTASASPPYTHAITTWRFLTNWSKRR
jgi:glucose/mannose transport system permease protein